MVRFGVHVGPQECSMAELRGVWQRAEELGYEWISVWDHFYGATRGVDQDCFEAISCHAALAATTTAARVGCLVYSAGFRHPSVMAKAAVTIDHLSGGRLELGVGAGWHEPEYRAFGIEFEPPAVRLRRLREYVEILRALLTQDRVDYAGEFWTINDAVCRPRPVQKAPPIWVGASGPRALAQAGAIGDGWNVAFVSPEKFAAQVEIVRANAPDPSRLATGVNLAPVSPHRDLEADLRQKFGPAWSSVAQGSLHGSTAQITDRVGRYVESGVDWVILALRAPFDLEAIEHFATDVAPSLR